MAELLGALEYAILIALLRLRDDAYGVSIRDELDRRGDRRVSLGAIYTTLDRLAKKGLVAIHTGPPTAVRGGRRKRMCRLTGEGERALAASWDSQRRLTEGLEGELARLPRGTGDV